MVSRRVCFLPPSSVINLLHLIIHSTLQNVKTERLDFRRRKTLISLLRMPSQDLQSGPARMSQNEVAVVVEEDEEVLEIEVELLEEVEMPNLEILLRQGDRKRITIEWMVTTEEVARQGAEAEPEEAEVDEAGEVLLEAHRNVLVKVEGTDSKFQSSSPLALRSAASAVLENTRKAQTR